MTDELKNKLNMAIKSFAPKRSMTGCYEYSDFYICNIGSKNEMDSTVKVDKKTFTATAFQPFMMDPDEYFSGKKIM